MKVLHVISGGETGGSKNHLLSLLDGLPQDEVMLCVFQKGALYDQAVALGIRTEVLQQSSRYDLSILTKLRQLIKAEKIDIVHSHGPRANLYCYMVSYAVSFRWITTVHSDPRDDFIRGGVKGRVFTAINMKILKRISHFFAVSERFKEMLVSFGIPASKITAIYNGIDFNNVPPVQIKREEIGLDEKHFAAIMVARLHPIKGHTEVFQAVQRIAAKHPEFRLLLVGDGPIKDELVREAEERGIVQNVLFLGFQKDVHSFFHMSDVELLASYSESFPLVLLEAARADTTIISTDVGGVKHLVPDNTFGWVIPVKDVDALEKALIEAIEKKNAGELEEMGKRLHAKASSEFSIQRLVNHTYSTYKEFMGIR
ncbi:glycosyltransferase family 4 protein [Fictibacillus aquaticus]|uniref:Glycosyltransferase n=1 Tax=Fictibacillus aquaticus TaxID=2021314 RepID=A0A235FEE3_9BACL|nr:glycosyltransferase family 4 protein [Fictibacillus aquaticus]OYD59760.1 glycosyltransferase [Fictibacillus aquaticus]